MRFVLIAALAGLAIVVPTTSVAADIQWQPDLQTAVATARSTGKPILLHFRSDACVWCDRLEAGAFRNGVVQQTINEQFVAVEINGSKDRQLANYFKVDRFPTDLIVTPEGQTLSRSTSPQEPGRYVAMLTDARSQLVAPAATPQPEIAPQPNIGRPPAAITPPAEMVAEVKPAPADLAPNSGPALPPIGYASRGDNAIPADAPEVRVASAASVPGIAPEPSASASPTGGSGMDPACRCGDNECRQCVATQPGPPSPVAPLVHNQTSRDQTSRDQASSGDPAAPPLALDGFCPVTVIDQTEWTMGDPNYGVVHLGRLYLFTGKAEREKFLADPVPYTPMLNGIDVVRFFEDRQVVQGKREFGVVDPDHNRIFLFADAESQHHFEMVFDRYVDSAIEVMNRAIADSNP